MAEQADMILGGGPIYTADPAGRRLVRATAPDGSPASAVAVAAGAIVAIGSPSDGHIDDLSGPATERIDLRGRPLLPGF